jgi:hypothetical protein
MLEKDLVNQKLEELFEGSFVSEVIHSTESKELVLIETKTDFALVTIKDFTHLPIGDYDVFIEKRVNKTESPLKDMAKMIAFLQNDTEKSVKQLQDKLLEMTGELVDTSKTFSKTAVLAIQNYK